jgi:hypothetical protein
VPHLRVQRVWIETSSDVPTPLPEMSITTGHSGYGWLHPEGSGLEVGARSLTRVIGTILLTGTVAACNPFGVETDRFIIAVDSMLAPESVAGEDTLVARFWGRIGPDLCSRLDRVDLGRGSHFITLRFHGVRREEGDCPHMPALLDHRETIPPPLEDPFTIQVLQPDGTSLEREVRVR